MIDDTSAAPIRRIRFWEHWSAAEQAFRDYAPGVDATVDHLRSANRFTQLLARYLLGPVYLSTDQGWTIRGARGNMAAILYLRRHNRQGTHTLHIDNVDVDARYRRQGLAQRLFAFAEESARRKGCSVLTLAVTVANAPAVTLYRRLGYQEQHHHLFTCDAMQRQDSVAVAERLAIAKVTSRPLTKAQATSLRAAVYRAELAYSTSDLARVLTANYPLWPLKPQHIAWANAVEQGGKAIGYSDARRQGTHCYIRFGLSPELWGSREESSILLALIEQASQTGCTNFSLSLMSAAHHAALSASSPAISAELGLVEKSTERMVMTKTLSL